MNKQCYASIGGVAVGAISVVRGFLIAGETVGSRVSNSSYGGDAYTGIQNAAAATARNVQELGGVVNEGIGAVLIFMGLALICFFLRQLFVDMATDQPAVAVAAPAASASAVAIAAEEETPVEVTATDEEWTCSCGYVTDGQFCPMCGTPKPEK